MKHPTMSRSGRARRFCLAATVGCAMGLLSTAISAEPNGGLLLYAMDGANRMILLADHRGKPQKWGGHRCPVKRKTSVFTGLSERVAWCVRT